MQNSVVRNEYILFLEVTDTGQQEDNEAIECKEDGFYAIPGQCSGNYFVCVNGIAYPQQCPPNLIYDPNTSNCVFLENSSCRPSSTTIQPTPTEETLTTPTPDLTWSSDLVPTEQTTEDITINTAHEVPTNSEEPEFSTTEYFLSTETSFSCPTPNGLFPNPIDCHSYFACSNNLAHLIDCPENLAFNVIIQRCDWPANVDNCNESVSYNDTTAVTQHTEPNESVEPTSSTESVASTGDTEPNETTKTINYTDSTILTETTEPNESTETISHTDFTMLTEATESNVSTDLPTVTSSTTEINESTEGTESSFTNASAITTDITQTPLFDCPEANGIFKHPENCNEFYICYNYIAIVSICPPDLVFNALIGQCDWLVNVPACREEGYQKESQGEYRRIYSSSSIRMLLVNSKSHEKFDGKQ